MANLDTTSKRRSSVQIMMTPILAPPAPDGTLDQGDRQHMAWTYSGILAGAPTPPPVTGTGVYIPTFRPRRRDG